MHTGTGRILELILADGCRYARVACPENLIPAPGQYLLASDGSDAILSRSMCSILPVPIFYTDFAPQGGSMAPRRNFISTMPDHWNPGDTLFLRGPLGSGFSLPLVARKVGLVAFDGAPSRLRGLIRPAFAQNAAVVLVCDWKVEDLPDAVEVQPLSALEEIPKWADYIALDVSREHLSELKERLDTRSQLSAVIDAQVLINTPMPCGGIAECAVCAVLTKSKWKMACKDGPVFDLKEI